MANCLECLEFNFMHKLKGESNTKQNETTLLKNNENEFE
jgi:hypothetical protein